VWMLVSSGMPMRRVMQLLLLLVQVMRRGHLADQGGQGLQVLLRLLLRQHRQERVQRVDLARRRIA